MAPQPSNKSATASTTNLLLRAKSTRARIMACFSVASQRLLAEHVVQDESVRHHLLARLQAGLDLLQIRVVLHQISTHHFHASKLLVGRGNEDKIAIVHVQDGGGRNDSVHLFGLAAEGGSRKHAEAHDSGILYLDANLSGAERRIKNRANVTDLSPEHAVGISIQGDLRGIPELDTSQVVLVHVANNPNRREIRYGERVGRTISL